MFLTTDAYFQLSYIQNFLQKRFQISDITIKLKNKNILTNQVVLNSLGDIGQVVGDLQHIIYNK